MDRTNVKDDKMWQRKIIDKTNDNQQQIDLMKTNKPTDFCWSRWFLCNHIDILLFEQCFEAFGHTKSKT